MNRASPISENKQGIDWAEKRWKELLVEQRKFMWLEDTVDKLADWTGLRPGMTAVDVGCGLGYLGYTYWRYFGEGGFYIGIDSSSENLKDAAEAAKRWAVDGEACFTTGEAYKLPFTDNVADSVMCQVLLMHLEKPKLALAEMVRVAKPGGLIICEEPDNLSSMLVRRYSSAPELDVEEELLSRKVTLIGNEGRIKLGRGDQSVGAKVPRMMKQLGLYDVEIRQNDQVWFLQPPYEGPVQKHRLEMVKRNVSDEKRYKFWQKRGREEFLAGGGDPEEYDRFVELSDRFRPIIRRQIEEGEFFACSAHHFFVIKGRKPR